MPYQDEVTRFATTADSETTKSTAMADQEEEEEEGGEEEGGEGAAALEQAPGHRNTIHGNRGASAQALQRSDKNMGRQVPASATVGLP